jgi:hypothetical protein
MAKLTLAPALGGARIDAVSICVAVAAVHCAGINLFTQQAGGVCSVSRIAHMRSGPRAFVYTGAVLGNLSRALGTLIDCNAAAAAAVGLVSGDACAVIRARACLFAVGIRIAATLSQGTTVDFGAGRALAREAQLAVADVLIGTNMLADRIHITIMSAIGAFVLLHASDVVVCLSGVIHLVALIAPAWHAAGKKHGVGWAFDHATTFNEKK